MCSDDFKKEFLPPLDEMRSTGTTLAERIRNYKANLQALENPVMDQIQGTVENIKRVDDVIFGDIKSERSSQ